jgi:hypothetical protein
VACEATVGRAAAGAPGAIETTQARVTADRMAAAQRAERGRMIRVIAGHSCPAAVAANYRFPRLDLAISS